MPQSCHRWMRVMASSSLAASAIFAAARLLLEAAPSCTLAFSCNIKSP